MRSVSSYDAEATICEVSLVVSAPTHLVGRMPCHGLDVLIVLHQDREALEVAVDC